MPAVQHGSVRHGAAARKDIPDEDRARAFFLFQYNDSTIMTSGKLFFGQWWATAIGARNVAEELTQDNSVTVNLEQVYEWNPGVIFMTNFNTAQPEDLYNNTVGTYDWSGIQAVQDQRVYKMPLGMYRSYTPRHRHADYAAVDGKDRLPRPL